MSMIRLQNLKRVFHEGSKHRVVFSELNVEVAEGEIVVVLGRSGSGKSTPLMADQELNLSFRYWEGAVRVSGTRAGSQVTGVGYVELTGYAE
jgi:ABC-type lipoprotein export system ATPase subunit